MSTFFDWLTLPPLRSWSGLREISLTTEIKSKSFSLLHFVRYNITYQCIQCKAYAWHVFTQVRRDGLNTSHVWPVISSHRKKKSSKLLS